MPRDESFGPAVKDGRVCYLSVSALDRADENATGGCLRKWFYRYVERRPEPTTKAQEVGTELHAEIEHYLKTGEMVLGPLALAGKEYIPEPVDQSDEILGVECSIKGLDILGIPVVGYVDLVRWSAPGEVEVRDWKTTSDIDRYAKTGQQLLETTQMVGYGEWVRRNYQPRAVRLSHVYFQTRGARRVEERAIVANAEEFPCRWELREPIARRIVDAARETDAEKVEANWRACSAYGGCPYRGICPRPAQVILADLLGGKNAMGLLDSLKKDELCDDVRISAWVDAVKKANMGFPTLEGEALLAVRRVTGGQPLPMGQLKELKVETLAKLEQLVSELAARADAPKTVAPDAPKPEELSPEVKAKPIPAEQLELLPSEVQEAAKAGGHVAEVVPVEEKKKRGRPRKKKVEEEKPEKPEKSAGVARLNVFVNCIPSLDGLQHLDGYIEGLTKAVAEKYKIRDIRLAPDDVRELAFGKWKGVLAVLVKSHLPEPGNYYLDTRGSEIREVVAEALRDVADLYVRGV